MLNFAYALSIFCSLFEFMLTVKACNALASVRWRERVNYPDVKKCIL